MKKAKVITICGSLRFEEAMKIHSERLELEGNCVLSVIYPVSQPHLTEPQIQRLGELHLQKIDMSDAIFVVNVGGYIGESTRKEIEYAQKIGKEVLLLETNNL